MSYDFATARICSHEVFFESVQLLLDHQTAKFLRPPSSKRVEVYVNKQKVPQSGLYSYAKIATTEIGPYDIRAGVNDMLQLKIGDSVQDIQLIPGRISAKDLARYLDRNTSDVISITCQEKRIIFSSRTSTNKTEFSFPDPRWVDTTNSLTLTRRVLGGYKELGIIPGRQVYGQQVYPGWTIQVDPMSPDGQDKLLFFNEPLKNNSPLIQINYVTLPQYCRRCRGTQLEFDYSILNGQYETVKNTDLLAQEFDKFLHTDIGSHWKWNWLGSALHSRIGGKGNTGSTSATSLLNADVSQAFKTYQSIKEQQDTLFPQQRVSDAEYPLELGSVQVKFDKNDPTTAIIDAVIVSRSSEDIRLEREIGNPNPVRLIGDNSRTFLLRS